MEGDLVVERGFGGFDGGSSRLMSSIEGIPHGVIHIVIGKDMSNLAKAAYDPIFFAHHANIDRLWERWRTPSDSAHALSEPWDVDGFANEGGNEIAWNFFDVASPEKPYRVSVAKTRNRIDLGYTYEHLKPLPPEFFGFTKDDSKPDEPHHEPPPALLGSQVETSSITPHGPGTLQSFVGQGFLAPGDGYAFIGGGSASTRGCDSRLLISTIQRRST